MTEDERAHMLTAAMEGESKFLHNSNETHLLKSSPYSKSPKRQVQLSKPGCFHQRHTAAPRGQPRYHTPL